MLERNNIGLVHTNKHVLGQNLLQILQGKECRDATLRGMEGHIFMLPLDKKQIIVIDLVEFVVGLHGDEVIGTANGVVRLIKFTYQRLLAANGLVDGLEETWKIKRFQQIVGYRKVECIDGIFRIRC